MKLVVPLPLTLTAVKAPVLAVTRPPKVRVPPVAPVMPTPEAVVFWVMVPAKSTLPLLAA